MCKEHAWRKIREDICRRYYPIEIFKFGVCVFYMLVILMLVVAFQKADAKTQEYQKKYQEELNVCKENGYAVFLDGEEVDADKIDLSLYTTSINHEEQVIYATQK